MPQIVTKKKNRTKEPPADETVVSEEVPAEASEEADFAQEYLTEGSEQSYISDRFASQMAQATSRENSANRQSDASSVAVLLGAYKRKRIIQCTIAGVTTIDREAYWTAFQDSVTIRIPFTSSFMSVPKDILEGTGYENLQRKRQFLTPAIGAKIRVVITSLIKDPYGGYIATASRTTALAQDRNYFFSKNSRLSIEQGMDFEAEVLSVGPHACYVTAFGMDIRLTKNRISHKYIERLTTLYKPGDTIAVRIMSLKTEVGKRPEITVSALPLEMKRLANNYKRLTIGDVVSGTVTSIRKESENTVVNLFLDGYDVPAFSRSVRLGLGDILYVGDSVNFRVNGFAKSPYGVGAYAHGSIIRSNN